MDLKTIKIFSSKREKSALKSDKPHKFNKRKLLTLPLSFALAFGMFSFPASGAAEPVLPGDIDGDGVQSTIGDMLLLGRVLANQQTISNWSYADLNGDGTVSLRDLHMLQDQMFSGAPLSPSRNEEPTGWEGQTIPFDVYDCDYINHTSLPVKRTGSDYPYEISTVSPGNLPNYGTPSYIPLSQTSDDRTVAANKAIVKFVGTGSGIIVGENMVLTAAHCLEDKSNNFYKNMAVRTYSWTNLTGTPTISAPTGTFYVKEVHIPSEFDGYYDNPELDFALLVVEGDLLHTNDNNASNDIVPMKLGIALNSLTGKSVSIIGYPSPVPTGSGAPNPTLYVDTDIVNGFVDVNYDVWSNSTDNYRLSTQTYCSPGQSGGAYYNENNLVVAICSGATPGISSVGTRITPLIYMFVNYNPNLS